MPKQFGLLFAALIAASVIVLAHRAHADEKLVGFGDAQLGMSAQSFLSTKQGAAASKLANCSLCYGQDTDSPLGGVHVYYTFRDGILSEIFAAFYLGGGEAKCMAKFDDAAHYLATQYGKFDGPPRQDGDDLIASKIYTDRELDIKKTGAGEYCSVGIQYTLKNSSVRF